MVFENTHPALIEQEVWDAVQRIRAHRKRPVKQETPPLFSGMLFCADCGAPLTLSRGISVTREQERYCCGHYIRAVVLEELVLENLKQTVAFAKEHEQEFVQRLMKRSMAEQQQQTLTIKRELAAKEQRAKEVDNIIKRLYEDNILGKLSDERFKILSNDYELEQRTLREEVQKMHTKLAEVDNATINIGSFLKVAKKYTSFDELTPGMLHDLIEKIVVHEGDKSSGHRQQQIDIYYTFIGAMEDTQVVAKLNLKGKAA